MLYLMQKFKLCIRKIGQSEIANALPSIFYVIDATEHIVCEIDRLTEIDITEIVKIQFRIESIVKYRFAVFHFNSVIGNFHSFSISNCKSDAPGQHGFSFGNSNL